MLYITKKTGGVVRNVLKDVNRVRISIFEKNFINYLKKDSIVRIVMFINNNDWCTIYQIKRALKIPKASLDRYLKILKEENIIMTEKKKGRNGIWISATGSH